MQRSRLDHVLAAGQAQLVTTGAYQGKGKGKGHHRGGDHNKGPTNDHRYAPQEQRDGQRREFRKDYAPMDSLRREFWKKVKFAHPELEQWTDLTRMVNEYLKGSYRKRDGLYYDSNTGKHKQAMVQFYNRYLKGPLDPPLTKFPDMYEKGMSDLIHWSNLF
jgi:hypothetical protein